MTQQKVVKSNRCILRHRDRCAGCRIFLTAHTRELPTWRRLKSRQILRDRDATHRDFKVSGVTRARSRWDRDLGVWIAAAAACCRNARVRCAVEPCDSEGECVVSTNRVLNDLELRADVVIRKDA